MTFYSTFSDYNNKKYGVEINAKETLGKDVNITMGGDPCHIDTSSGKLFDPIKSRSCTLEFVTKDWYFQLYEPKSRGTTVKIYEYDENYEHNVKKVIFRGYLTPCSYDQDWTYLDTITLEAVDALSTTKDFKFKSDGTYKTFADIILSILSPSDSDDQNIRYQEAIYKGNLYVPNTFTHINGEPIFGDVLDKLKVSSGNFIDDDDEKTPWTQYDILFEIMQFLGWSMIPDGDNVWCIDYRALGKGASIIYSVYDIVNKTLTGQTPSLDPDTVNIGLSIMSAGTTSISIDDVYNKIEISDNLYKIDEISPDIFDDGIHISVTEEKNMGLDGSQWTKYPTKKFLWWTWADKTEASTTVKDPIGYDYQTICRLDESSGWYHNYYRHSTLSKVGSSNPNDPNYNPQGYFDQYTYDDSNWIFKTSGINTYMNTHGCLIQHYAHVNNTGLNNLPATIDWTDILTFFVFGPTSPTYKILELEELEKPVLEYNIDEEIQWKPATGTSWITIKGDLFYQTGGSYDKKKKKNKLSIINTDEPPFYVTSPVDKAVDGLPSDRKYCGMYRSKKDFPDSYGLGFSCWKMKLQIGDKYYGERFDSSAKKYVGYWTTDPDTTFYIQYNNNPDGDDDEFIPEYQWVSTVNNMNYKDKVGVDAHAIKIDSEDTEAPTIGKLKLTIYTPSVFPKEYQYLQALAEQAGWIWEQKYGWTSDLAPIIYCKDFELGYVYTSTEVWYNNHQSNNKADKVYTGNINDKYIKTFDRLEFKLNTSYKDAPISRSYVTTVSGDYLQTMRHIVGSDGDVDTPADGVIDDKEQEFNVVDAYLDHHSERKPIIECNIKNLAQPNSKYLKNMIEGMYVLDSQSFDVRKNNNRIKIISF